MKKFKTAQEYIDYIRDELENANYHNQIELPENLFNRISTFLGLKEQLSRELAIIIVEEFYKNI